MYLYVTSHDTKGTCFSERGRLIKNGWLVKEVRYETANCAIINISLKYY